MHPDVGKPASSAYASVYQSNVGAQPSTRQPAGLAQPSGIIPVPSAGNSKNTRPSMVAPVSASQIPGNIQPNTLLANVLQQQQLQQNQSRMSQAALLQQSAMMSVGNLNMQPKIIAAQPSILVGIRPQISMQQRPQVSKNYKI